MGMIVTIGFLCSLLVIAPVIALLLSTDKAGKRYATCWWGGVVAFAAICMGTFAYILSWPLYSRATHQTLNPGGPSGSILLAILFWILLWTIVVPSFPMLFLLGLSPPKSYSKKRRLRFTVAITIYVLVLGSLVLAKHQVYMADYRREMAKPKQTPFERFEHLRTSTAGNDK